MSAVSSDHRPPSDAAPPLVRRRGWYPDPRSESDLRWFNGDEWTSYVRPFEADGPDRLTIWGVILGAIMPILGIAIAIVLLGRNRLAPGFAVLAASALGAVIWLALSSH